MSLQILQPPSRKELLETLSRLPKDWRFCVVGKDKAPMDPAWQKTPLDHAAVAERIQRDRRVGGIGLLTGQVSGGLVAVDFDGASAADVLPSGLTLTELPDTVAYTSGKLGRHQRLYRVPLHLWETTATRKIKTGVIGADGKDEQLELRWTGLQSVITGQHPETGAYRWVEGCAPWEIEVAEAPPEILQAMEREIRRSVPRPYLPPAGLPASEDEIDVARAMLAHIPASYADDYESWVAVGMALHSVSDALLDDWIDWSAQSPKFDGNRKLERKWDSFQRSGITIATLVKLAKEGGYRPTRRERRVVHRHQVRGLQLLTRNPNRLHTGGWLTADYIPSPEQHRLVCLHAAMRVGKTEAIAAHLKPLIAAGVPIILVTHRRTLGESLSSRLGVPWVEECIPGSDLRVIGLGGCIDSMHPHSKLRFCAQQWPGAIVIVDEAELWIDHLLNGKTEVAKHRPEIMVEIAGVLKNARQVIAADALMSDTSVKTLEALIGAEAYIVGSNVQPFDGAPVYFLESEAIAAALMVEFAQAGKRLAVFTDKQKNSKRTDKPSLYSASTLARRLSETTGEQVPVIDSAANKRGELQELKSNPMAFINGLPHLVATPSIDAGLSITQEGDDRLFDAMFIFAGSGHLAPGAIVQWAGRVRSNIPRFIVCPETSSKLRAGNGSPDPADVANGLSRHQAVILGQLAQAGINIGEPIAAQSFLTAWSEIAARRNREGLAYAATVRELLIHNGFNVQDWDGAIDPFLLEVNAELQAEAATAITESEINDVLNAQDITPATAEAIAKAEVATAKELAELQRYHCKQQWGDCTRQLLAATDEGLYAPLRLAYWFALGKTAAAERDAAKLEKRRDRAMFAPDLVDACIAPAVKYLYGLQLDKLLARKSAISLDDPLIREIVATIHAHRAGAAQVLGVEITEKTKDSTLIRNLLKRVGFKFKSTPQRFGKEVTRVYRVIPDEAIADLPLEQIFGHWLEKTRLSQGLGSCNKNPIDLLLSRFVTETGTSKAPSEVAA